MAASVLTQIVACVMPGSSVSVDARLEVASADVADSSAGCRRRVRFTISAGT